MENKQRAVIDEIKKLSEYRILVKTKKQQDLSKSYAIDNNPKSAGIIVEFLINQ
jgi:hypothetical protein